jgi:hypothetical protein
MSKGAIGQPAAYSVKSSWVIHIQARKEHREKLISIIILLAFVASV